MRTQSLIITLGTLSLSLASFAASLNEATVRQAAENWLLDASATGLIDQQPQISSLEALSWDQGTPGFYRVRFGEDGWMLMSADDLLLPVFGWGEGKADELPEALEFRLQEEEQMLRAHASASSDVALAAWNGLVAADREASRQGRDLDDAQDVSALIAAEWHQNTGWNSNCPEDASGPGGHAFVGCVAVAMGQVMSYWNWPQSGEGINSYIHDTYGEISVDFSQADYFWSTMMDVGATEEAAEILYHAGAAINMDYGASSSSAQTSRTVGALIDHFQYKSTARLQWRMSYTDEEWLDLARSELQAGRPLIYRGQGSAGGHCFNVDGVQDSTWFHLNWGWAGNYNGYFLLDDLSPGTWTFNSFQAMVISLEPDTDFVNTPPTIPTIEVESLEDETVSIEFAGYDQDGDELAYYVQGFGETGDIWTWTPPQDAFGSFEFLYFAYDGEVLSDAGMIYIDVIPVNDVPVAMEQVRFVGSRDSVRVHLDAMDADHDELVYFLDGVQVESDCVWVYMAPQDIEMALPFHVSDGSATSATVEVLLTRKAYDKRQDNSAMIGTVEFGGGDESGDAFVIEQPATTRLLAPWPNPFNPVTTIGFELELTGNVKLAIFNLLGQEVKRLVDGLLESGQHQVTWTPDGLASGTYLAVLQTENGLQRQVMQYLK